MSASGGGATSASGAPAGRSFRYTAIARTSASLICEVELTTTSAIGPPAWLLPLRPLERYSTTSSTLQEFKPLREALSRRGANQPSTNPPPYAFPRLSAPRMFLGVWQAPQCAAPVTR